jgi:hypothetical protein
VQPEKIKVKPRVADGNPCKVPRSPGTVLRPGEDWPIGAFPPGGERVRVTPYIKSLLRSGDLEEVKLAKKDQSEVGEEDGERPTKRRRTKAAKEE